MITKALNRDGHGFTLIELLIVMVVIGVLAGFVFNTLSTAQKRGRDAERITDIRAIHKSLEVFFSEGDGYPDEASFELSLFPGLNQRSLIDPRGGLIKGAAAEYTYTPATCASGLCTSYQVGSVMEDGPAYQIDSLNQ